MPKKQKAKPQRRNKFKGLESNGVEVVYTNAYSSPIAHPKKHKRNDFEEEEKTDSRREPHIASKPSKFIDARIIIRSSTEFEIIEEIRRISANELSPNRLINYLIRALRMLSIPETESGQRSHSLVSSVNEESNILGAEDKVLERKRYARLTDSQKLFIAKEVKLNKRSVNEVAKSMNVSSSSIRRSVNQMWTEGRSTKKWFDLKLCLKQITWRTEKVIKSFVSQRRQWYTASHVRDHINKEIKQNISWDKIRKYFKQKLRLSYKKGTSKPWNVKIDKLKLGRVWFSCKLVEQINYKTLLINIDETNLSNSVFHNWSWFPIGKSGEIFKVSYKGSISLVLAITSEGDYFESIVKEPVDSTIYKEFLENLEQWLMKTKEDHFDSIILIHDNAPIHRANRWLELMESDRYTHAFLPPYTPEYAPIELVFSSLKHLVKKNHQKTLIDFKTEAGIAVVANSLSKPIRKTIIRCWGHSMERMRWDIKRFIHNWS